MVVEEGSTAGENVGEVQATQPEGVAPSETGLGESASPPIEGAEQTPEPATYTPNFKYKVLKDEKEIPEWARALVTDAEKEKQVRELFEKSEGLEVVKEHRTILENENKAMREHWGPQVQVMQEVSGYLQKKDYDSFFEACNVPEVEILKYALKRLQLRENPAELAAYNEQRELQKQNLTWQQKYDNLLESHTGTVVQQRERELESHLSRPEILSVVQAFDARVGRPGAFRAEVINRGKLYAQMNQDVPVEQAVQEILTLVGASLGTNQSPGIQGATTAAQTGMPSGGETPRPRPPVLPNIKGKGTSPAKKAVRSVADLRKLAKQYSAQE